MIAGDLRAFSASEYLAPHKRIGLVGCAWMDLALTGPLQQMQVSFAQIDADTVEPGDRGLEQYHAVILQVGNGEVESPWFRPEILQTNTRPLLLTGEPDAVWYRASLQNHADDIIFAPFAPSELIFRLSRLIGGTSDSRRAVAPSPRPCVLVADDDRDIITYLKCVLQNFDVDLHFVSDGAAALAAARRLLPDVLLLDIGMPVLSGIDVLGCLKNDPGTREIPTLLLTASADPLDVAKGLELGAADYILKPFGQFALIQKLKHHLQGRRSRVRTTAGHSILSTNVQEALRSGVNIQVPPDNSSDGRSPRVRL